MIECAALNSKSARVTLTNVGYGPGADVAAQARTEKATYDPYSVSKILPVQQGPDPAILGIQLTLRLLQKLLQRRLGFEP